MDNDITFGKIIGGLVALTVCVLALFGLLGSWFIIDQGERGVVLRNGAFVRVAEPGLGFKLPILDSVVNLSVRTEKQIYDKMMAYSQDIQLAELRVSVNYRLDIGKTRHVYENFGNRAPPLTVF